jgi:dTDP-4-amino-4,6-dideoxygalactose transaminase
LIPVTKPFLPPFEEYCHLLKDIWRREWLTNNGPLVNELELKLKEYLRVPHMLYLSNGTIALQIAIKALGLKGEIITTPFSYVATTSSILWEGSKPVFVDIDSETLNIDTEKIEAAITPHTSAILSTHVFGNPCDIDRIHEIACRYNLKVIYDAAHCFGTTYKGRSVFNYGDVSATSFHATKLFHTIEGGAVFCSEPDLLKKMAYLRNFGHNGPDNFAEIGINGKNSEFHAAMGLLNLGYIDEIMQQREMLSRQYDVWLRRDGIIHPAHNKDAVLNYAYYPVIFESEELTLRVQRELEANRISPRRYFHPSLSTIPIFNPSSCPVSDELSSRILCLPLYHSLSFSEVDYICRIVIRTLNN